MPEASFNCVCLGRVQKYEKKKKEKKKETLMEIHRSKAISRFIFSWPHKKEAAPTWGCVGCLNRKFGKLG